MEESESTLLREAVIGIIEKQIDNNKPKETKQTLNRLISEGISHDEALRYISCVVTSEIFEVLRNGELHDEDKYVRALKKLPKLPWEIT